VSEQHSAIPLSGPQRQALSAAWLYWVVGACGFATGIVGAAFHLAVDTLFQWPLRLVERFDFTLIAIAAAAGIGATGTLLAYLLTRYVAPEAAGSGVPEVEGALEGLRVVRWQRILPVKFIGGLLALSSGLVAGREGPTIHMGAAIGALLAERLRLARPDFHTLLAAGAAAGLAAAFNAPLAAVLFVIEETRKQFTYTFRSYVSVIAASAASAFGMELPASSSPTPSAPTFRSSPRRRRAPSAWSWSAAPHRRFTSSRWRCRSQCCRCSWCWARRWERSVCCSIAASCSRSMHGRPRSRERRSSIPFWSGRPWECSPSSCRLRWAAARA
jgi:hypothetical protein